MIRGGDAPSRQPPSTGTGTAGTARAWYSRMVHVSLVPTFVTHYHHAGRAPFLNLSDLPDEHLTLVLAELAVPAEQTVSARRFGPRYMALRRATETCLRERFVAAGGRPQRRAPHYFVLGASDWFAGLYLHAGTVRLPLSALPPEVTSLTYADSITAMGLGVPLGLPAPHPDHAGRVYRLDALHELAARHNPHADDAPDQLAGYTGHQHQPVDSYVEVQLWSNEPVLAHLRKT